jgi:hypothetical protein
MRWFAAMMAFVALLVAGIAWVALRDYQSGDALHGQRAEALLHAGQLLRLSEGGRPCPYCRADVVGPLREHVWRVSLQMQHRLTCFDIDNDRFALRPSRGVTGVREAACPET